MGIDPLSVVAPARVKIVCVPVGRIKQSRFSSFVARLEEENVVRLGDVSPDNRPHSTLFSPLAYPAGRVLFEIRTSFPPKTHLALSPFELYRQPFVIVAVADYRGFEEISDSHGLPAEEVAKIDSHGTLSEDSVQTLLQHRHQLASEYSLALVHHVLVFDYDVSHQRLPEGLIGVPPPAQSMGTTMKTVMCDLTSQLLAEMASFARSLQEIRSIETPRVPRQSIQRPLSRYSGLSRPASADPNQATPSSMSDAQRNEHRMSELVDGATIAKVNSDHVWHGKALDYLLVVCLLYAWAGLGFHIPQIFYQVTDKIVPGSSKASKDTPASSHADLMVTSPDSSTGQTLQSLSSLLPDLVTTIQNLYSRAWTFSEDKLPQLAFSDTGLRFSKLLTIIAASNSMLTDTNLTQIVLNMQARQATVHSKTVLTFQAKADIAAFLFRSFPNADTDLSLAVADRTAILAGTVSILSELNYHRKRAFVMKELLEGLIPALVEARKRGAAEMGVHPAASLATLDIALYGAQRTPSHLPYGEDEIGLQSFLKRVSCEYGVDVGMGNRSNAADEVSPAETQGTDKTATSASLNSTKGSVQRAIYQASSKISGSLELKIDVLRLCINVCEALPDLEGVLQFSTELLRTSGSGIAPGPDNSSGSPSLSIEDQLRLWNNISRTVGVARQLGLKELSADYWDEFLLRGIEVVPSTSDIPIPHAKGDLEAVTKSNTDTSSGPFLYNPFRQDKPAKNAKPLVVAGEEAVFRVTLQNLYNFDLEIESIQLRPDNDNCDSVAQAVTVGPYRTQTVYLAVTPLEGGPLNVSGCIAKVRGCHERWFPLFDAPWSLKPNVKEPQSQWSAALLEKSSETRRLPEKGDARALKGPIPSSAALDVIPALPIIVLKSMSLSRSAIMLLEGETKTFTITLYNASRSVIADLILLTSEDSTTALLQAAREKKELPPTDLYELELASTKKPLRWCRAADEPDVVIEPGKELTLNIEVTGKPGLSGATIQVSYGHLGVSRSQIKDLFYTRQLSIPLAITVNASIDITRTDLLSFSSIFAWQNQQRQMHSPSTKKADSPPVQTRRPSSVSSRPKSHKFTANNENRFQSLLSRIGLSTNDNSHCLLCLDCRNSWPTPLSISIQVRSSHSEHITDSTQRSPSSDTSQKPGKSKTTIAYTVHESLLPGTTKRILLLLPRLRLPHAHNPIPILSAQKQFVVGTGPKTSYEAELNAREMYWYRETLLNLLQATWTEESTGRKGQINIRNIRLSERMINILKLPELETTMTLALPNVNANIDDLNDFDKKNKIEQMSPTTYLVPLSHPLVLTTTLTNHSNYLIHPLLRLQPRLAGNFQHSIALDLGRKLLIHGQLQKVLPVLAPGASVNSEVEVWVLGKGRWVVGGVVEEVRVLESEDISREDGDDVGDRKKRERRVWGIEEEVEVVGKGD
ncbi:MAG: hypothetical protein Q9181_004334 [Wetmoreana brouardii]